MNRAAGREDTAAGMAILHREFTALLLERAQGGSTIHDHLARRCCPAATLIPVWGRDNAELTASSSGFSRLQSDIRTVPFLGQPTLGWDVGMLLLAGIDHGNGNGEGESNGDGTLVRSFPAQEPINGSWT